DEPCSRPDEPWSRPAAERCSSPGDEPVPIASPPADGPCSWPDEPWSRPAAERRSSPGDEPVPIASPPGDGPVPTASPPGVAAVLGRRAVLRLLAVFVAAAELAAGFLAADAVLVRRAPFAVALDALMGTAIAPDRPPLGRGAWIAPLT